MSSRCSWNNFCTKQNGHRDWTDPAAKYILALEVKAFCRLWSLWVKKRDWNPGIPSSGCAFSLPDERGVWRVPLWVGSGVGWACLLTRHGQRGRQSNPCSLDLRSYPHPGCAYGLRPRARSFCAEGFAGTIPGPEPAPAGSSLQLWAARQVI